VRQSPRAVRDGMRHNGETFASSRACGTGQFTPVWTTLSARHRCPLGWIRRSQEGPTPSPHPASSNRHRFGEGRSVTGFPTLPQLCSWANPRDAPLGSNSNRRVARIQYFGRQHNRQSRSCAEIRKGPPWDSHIYIILCMSHWKCANPPPCHLNNIDSSRHAPLDDHTPSAPLPDLPKVVLHQRPPPTTHTCPHWREETPMPVPWLPNQVLSPG